jgi:alkylhydroperoxidase family enzyme
VPEGVFEKIKEFLDERRIVEGTVTIAAANAVNRSVVALGVGGKRKRDRNA